MRQFLLQMAGEAGTGKSTVAHAIGRATGAIVIEKDVIKATMYEEGLSESAAAGLAYAVFFALVPSLLSQGLSVVLDSPAFYPTIRDRGQAIAREHRVTYRIIETVCPDPTEHATRLLLRDRLSPQPVSLDVVIQQRDNPERVAVTEQHLALNTDRPLDVCLAEALAYLKGDEA